MKALTQTYGPTLARMLDVQCAKFARVGWTFTTVSGGAPCTHEAINASFYAMVQRREPFPVWSGASDTSVFGSALSNHQFRFLHDTFHGLYGTTMHGKGGLDFAGEMDVHGALARMLFGDNGDWVAEDARTDINPTQLVYLLHTVGQTVCHDLTGEFPEDQSAFVNEVANTLEGNPDRSIRRAVQQWLKVPGGRLSPMGGVPLDNRDGSATMGDGWEPDDADGAPPAGTITLEQYKALKAYAAKHWADWKAKLHREWCTGKASPEMQAIRKDMDPEWWENFQG